MIPHLPETLGLMALALLALLCLPYTLRLLWRAFRYVRLARSGIRKIDRMDGDTFEAYLETLFRRLGYRVQRTPSGGDFGADLVVEQGGVRTVVQAKRYTKAVGVSAIQEAVAAKAKYRCDDAMVVTNSHFTRPAVELAEANGVELWDREELIRRALSCRKAAHPEPEAVALPPTPPLPTHSGTCATCGQPVSARDLRHSTTHASRYGGRTYCYQHLPRNGS